MKHETLFVDETTKKTMEQIHEGIIDSVNDVLRSTNALNSIEKLADEISGKFDTLQKTMEDLKQEIDSQKSTIINVLSHLHEAATENNDAMTREIDSLKSTIINVLSNQEEAAAKNNDAVIAQIRSLEMKINVISTVIENQNRNFRLLEEINKKLNYISLPFYKRIIKKFQKENDTPSDINKEDK